MVSSVFRYLALGASLFILEGGCASSAPEVVAPVVPVSPVVPARAAEPLDLVDTALWVGRWIDPQQWLEDAESWLPKGVALGIALRSRLAQPSFPVDLQAPIEGLVVLDTSVSPVQLRWAFSLGLRVPLGTRIESRAVPSPIGLQCREAPSLGRARARVICSNSAEDLSALLPQLTRAMPFAAVSSSALAIRALRPQSQGLSSESGGEWLTEWLAKKLGIEIRNAKVSERLATVSTGLERELWALLDDFNGATLEAHPNHESHTVDWVVRLPNVEPTSHWLKATVGQRGVGLAPEEFWNFNVDAQQAGFHWSAEPHSLSGAREPLARLLGSILEFRGVPKRLEIQAMDLLDLFPLPPGPLTWASGGSSKASPTRLWTEALGWNVRAFGAGFPSARRAMGQWVRAFEDPIIGSQMRRLMRASLGRQYAPTSMVLRRPARRLRLPVTSFEVELEFAASPAAPEALPSLHVLFVPSPDDGFAVGWGADRERLARALTSGLGRGWAGTLSGRAGLGELHKVRALSGGFASLSSLPINGVHGVFEGLWSGVARSVDDAPHRGQTPILLHLLSGSSNSSLEYRASLTEPSLTDLLFLLGID